MLKGNVGDGFFQKASPNPLKKGGDRACGPAIKIQICIQTLIPNLQRKFGIKNIIRHQHLRGSPIDEPCGSRDAVPCRGLRGRSPLPGDVGDA